MGGIRPSPLLMLPSSFALLIGSVEDILEEVYETIRSGKLCNELLS
jgi:hypothetical protein